MKLNDFRHLTELVIYLMLMCRRSIYQDKPSRHGYFCLQNRTRATITNRYPSVLMTINTSARSVFRLSSVIRCEMPNNPKAIPIHNGHFSLFFAYPNIPNSRMTMQSTRFTPYAGSHAHSIPFLPPIFTIFC